MNSILRKKLINAALYMAVAIFGLGLLVYTKDTSAAASESIGICLNILIPSLFPFLVISGLAVKSGLAGAIGRLFEKPMRFLFNVPGACAPAFILGLIGGYPVGAKTAMSIFDQKLCTKDEAERLLAFCNNSGPAFILGAVGAGIFGSVKAGVILYISHIAASVIVGVLFRGKGKAVSNNNEIRVNVFLVRDAFISSVKEAGSAVGNVCCFVVFFSVAIRLLYRFGIIPTAAFMIGELISPLGLDAAFAEKLISGFFEVTSGVNGLIDLSTPKSASLAAAAFMLGWAGISVHFQILSFIGEKGLRTWPFFAGKTMHAFLSAFLTWLAVKIIPFEIAAAGSLKESIGTVASLDFSSSSMLAGTSSFIVWGGLGLLSSVLRKKR